MISDHDRMEWLIEHTNFGRDPYYIALQNAKGAMIRAWFGRIEWFFKEGPKPPNSLRDAIDRAITGESKTKHKS